MRSAHIKGALVGVEAVTPEGLKDVYKDFNARGEALVDAAARVPRARRARARLVHLRTAERPRRARSTRRSRRRARGRHLRAVRDADAVPRHARLRGVGEDARRRTRRSIDGIPITRHWLIPQADRPKVYTPHPVMSADEIRDGTQGVWDRVLQPARNIWERSRCVRVAEVAAGVRADLEAVPADVREHRASPPTARASSRANRWARLIAKPCRRLFVARPLPALASPIPDA